MAIGNAASRLRTQPCVWASVAFLLVFGWQALTVHGNYAGHWSGLFRTGRGVRVPADLQQSTFRSVHPAGYDGQFYRFLAHDPFLVRGNAAYLDSALLRSRRILVPLLAWLLAAGQQDRIDGAYVLVVNLSIFAGVYWFARIMMWRGWHAAWGLLFLAVPAVLVSADSMTVDVALAALSTCFAYQLISGSDKRLWFTIAAAGLVRETGLLLATACVLTAVARRDFRKAAFWATAFLPALTWYGYLQWVLPHTPNALHAVVPRWVRFRFRLGILVRLFNPQPYPLLSPQVRVLVQVLDSVALLATMAAAALCVQRLRTTQPGALRAALGLQVALVLVITSWRFWIDPYGYTRLLTPMFVLLLTGGRDEPGKRALLAAALVVALVDLRICAELQSQASGVLRLLLGS